MVVVYFSRAGENYGVGNVKVGNTAKLAEAIAEETDAPLIEITRNEPYPEGYDEATSVAQDERRRPPVNHAQRRRRCPGIGRHHIPRLPNLVGRCADADIHVPRRTRLGGQDHPSVLHARR